ncbi:hypothetical protein VKT23_019181 [Stygiomarasmius scandens]|uniref:Ankyrin repeat protein n=1 Tax=Marasmiellus scandens TaxID=2682957 RepID=A0ABR1IQ05_9AGAR
MVQNFLHRISTLSQIPAVDRHSALHEILQFSIEDESKLRSMWAQDNLNPLLQNPYVGLIEVFEAPDRIRDICPRNVAQEGLMDKYVMALGATHRKKEGDTCMVDSMDEFIANWSIFTEGMFSKFQEWDNVIAAGGSVLACLMSLPSDELRLSERELREFYHVMAYPSSDIDIFLWGLTPQQAEEKIIAIYQAVLRAVPNQVICVRTANTVSFHSQHPYRSIQIVLRLYSSPAEVLAGFDIDAPCCAYDGKRVWASARAIIAMMRQCNTVDMTRRSPSYEFRLSKYAQRGFEIYIPSLERDKVDTTIYLGHIKRTHGLARLLVLESLRDRFNAWRMLYRLRKIYRNTSNDAAIVPEELEVNNYELPMLSIPYGPSWDANKIERLVKRADTALNFIRLHDPLNPEAEEQRPHRHPAFVSTSVKKCLEDRCTYDSCPTPIEEEDKKFVRGSVSFIQRDPGRQMISGSFHPIDNQEWTEQISVGTMTNFFREIIAGDRNGVKKLIEAEIMANTDTENTIINKLDRLGRTPLHIAILAKQNDIACDLIDTGAKIRSKMSDGRTALHCAAQMDLTQVIHKLMAKSEANSRGSNRDDVLDVNAAEQDLGFAPISFAIIFASLTTIDIIIAAGARLVDIVDPSRLIKCRAEIEGNHIIAREIACRLGVKF